MSQRGYKIDFTVEAGKATFSLSMAWEVLEPYVINNNFGIASFSRRSVMVLSLYGIRKYLETSSNELLSKIIAESKSDEDIAIYRIV